MNQNLKSTENVPIAEILLLMEQQRAVAIIRQLNVQLVTGDRVMGVVDMKIVDEVQRYEPEVDFYTGKFYGMTTSPAGDYVTLKDYYKLAEAALALKEAFKHLQFSTQFLDGSPSQKEASTLAEMAYNRAIKKLEHQNG